MTTAQLAERLEALEKTVAELKSELAKTKTPTRRWWAENAGRFAGDSAFDEIVRLGRAYRESLRPRAKKRKK
jgi:hypothetical protein